MVGKHIITLTVTDNDGATASDTVVVTVTAVDNNQTTEPNIVVSTTNLNFDNQIINTSSNTKNLTIQNTGTVALALNNMYLTGQNGGEFDFYNGTCSSSINPNESCTLNVDFAPTSEGNKTGLLVIESNDIDTPTANISLSGEGISSTNNNPLIANAGADQTVTQGSSVTLNASGSSDSDGTITSYKWSENGALLSMAQTFKTSSLSVGRHTMLLKVTDNGGLTATDEVIVTVNDALLKEYTINIDNNWTFVSLPSAGTLHVNDINNTHIKIIRSFQNGQWYVWTSSNQFTTEQALTELTENNGYWIKSDAPTTIKYTGNSLPAPIDFSTQNGKWKMYGSTQIDDPNLFFTNHTNITILWKYTNGAWQAISKDANINDDLSNAGIEQIYFINSDEAFWAGTITSEEKSDIQFNKPSKLLCETNGGVWDDTINECKANWSNANKICSLPSISILRVRR